MDHDDSMLSTSSSDGDIDESMITEPTQDANDDDDEQDDDEQDLYPAAGTTNKHSDSIGRPQTPQNDHLNAAAPGELSPPRSQTTTQDRESRTRGAAGGGLGAEDIDDLDLSPTNPNMGAVGSGSTTAGTGPAANAGAGVGAGASATTEWKAGYGWKNKKAQSEMQKARDGLSDRDFSLKIFGDVLAHRIGLDVGHRE